MQQFFRSLICFFASLAVLSVNIYTHAALPSDQAVAQQSQPHLLDELTRLEQYLTDISDSAEVGSLETHDHLLELWREAFKINKALTIDPNIQQANALSEESFNSLFKKSSHLYNQLSSLRAALIVEQGVLTVYQGYSEDYFNDFLREIESVPIRWFGIAQELLSVLNLEQNNDQSNQEKLLFFAELFINEFSKALFYLMLGFVLLKATKKLSRTIKSYTVQLAKKGVHNKSAREHSILLRRVYPYLNWAILLTYIYMGSYLLESGRFEQLSFLVPYIIYYIWFRVVRIMIAQILASGVQFPEILGKDAAQNKLSWTAKWLSLYAFWVVILIHTLKTITGEGLFFYWFSHTSGVFSFILSVCVAYQWRNELKKLAEFHLRGWLQTVLKWLSSGWRALVFSLPLAIFFLLFISFSRLYRWSERFEVVRRLSAYLFRRQIESSAQSVATLSNVPKDYKRVFLEANIVKKNQLSQGQKAIYQTLRQAISGWLNNDCDEMLAVIIGDQGSGKSQVASFLLKDFKNEHQTETLHIQKRDANQLQLKAIELLIDDYLINESNAKKIVVIEQVEHLFISKVGGFDAFMQLLEKIQSQNKHCFFIFLFNSEVWDFLSLKFQSVEYFSLIQKIPEWTEAEIKSLILSQHEMSSYTLNFDDIIEAAKGESDYDAITYIEDKYFRLLREESKGNPAVAKELWLGCLSYIGNNQLKVSIPRDRAETIMMPENYYFVLACIVRHWCINEADIVAATDLPVSVVRSVLKKCKKQHYIIQVGGEYKLNLTWQHSILSTLRRKNFIYS